MANLLDIGCKELDRFALKRGTHSAATPARENMSPPSLSASADEPSPSFAAPFAFCLRSKLSHTSFQFPLVAALEYSVERCSKKLACSTPFSSGASQGRGCSSTM